MYVLLRAWLSQQDFYNSCMTETAKLPPFCLRCQSRCIAFLKRILQELLCLIEKSLLLCSSLLSFSNVCYCCATEKVIGNTDIMPSYFILLSCSKSVLCCRSSLQFFPIWSDNKKSTSLSYQKQWTKSTPLSTNFLVGSSPVVYWTCFLIKVFFHRLFILHWLHKAIMKSKDRQKEGSRFL